MIVYKCNLCEERNMTTIKVLTNKYLYTIISNNIKITKLI